MGEPDESKRPGRAIVFLGDQTLERLFNLPAGMRITGVSDDFLRLGILLSVEAPWLPPLEEGMHPFELSVSDLAGPAAELDGLELDACDVPTLAAEVHRLRRSVERTIERDQRMLDATRIRAESAEREIERLHGELEAAVDRERKLLRAIEARGMPSEAAQQ